MKKLQVDLRGVVYIYIYVYTPCGLDLFIGSKLTSTFVPLTENKALILSMIFYYHDAAISQVCKVIR